MKNSSAATTLGGLRLSSPTKRRDPVRPPLKWVGGKRWQVPYVQILYEGHEHRRLVEPFSGGLAITLALQPKRALVNDINAHLINFYDHLKHGLRIDFQMSNSEIQYYRGRDRFNELIAAGDHTSAEAAGLFYYLNRTGYNGLCRFNRSGGFNVPFGRYARLNYTTDFTPYRKTFAGWKISNKDFEALSLSSSDFIYADPPYDVEFTKYSKEGFSWDDQVRLAEWLVKRPGPVVLSNQATPRITELYKSLGFRLNYHQAPRMISCNGDRTPATEVLATRNF